MTGSRSVAPVVAALGHEVIAGEIELEDVGAVTARERGEGLAGGDDQLARS
jgi:hypothetical protein